MRWSNTQSETLRPNLFIYTFNGSSLLFLKVQYFDESSSKDLNHLNMWFDQICVLHSKSHFPILSSVMLLWRCNPIELLKVLEPYSQFFFNSIFLFINNTSSSGLSFQRNTTEDNVVGPTVHIMLLSTVRDQPTQKGNLIRFISDKENQVFALGRRMVED